MASVLRAPGLRPRHHSGARGGANPERRSRSASAAALRWRGARRVSGRLSLRRRSDRHLRCGDHDRLRRPLRARRRAAPLRRRARRAMSGWLRMHRRSGRRLRDGQAADCPGVCRPVAPNECVDDAGCAAKDSPCTLLRRRIAALREGALRERSVRRRIRALRGTDVVRRHHRRDLSAGLRVRGRSQRHVHAGQRCRLSGHLPAGSRRRVYQ